PWLFAGLGLFPTRDQRLERALLIKQKQASLSQSIAFLARTQKIFQLWHVVHRPFSYAFAILAILHIGIALFMVYRLLPVRCRASFHLWISLGVAPKDTNTE